MDNFSFGKLQAYAESKKLVVEVYKIIKDLPAYENFALCSQIRRAIVSVPSNIAEGSGRISIKEKIHFLEIAFGSLLEAYCQIEISQELGYISKEKFSNIKPIFFSVSRLINALRKSFVEKLNNPIKH